VTRKTSNSISMDGCRIQTHQRRAQSVVAMMLRSSSTPAAMKRCGVGCSIGAGTVGTRSEDFSLFFSYSLPRLPGASSPTSSLRPVARPSHESTPSVVPRAPPRQHHRRGDASGAPRLPIVPPASVGAPFHCAPPLHAGIAYRAVHSPSAALQPSPCRRSDRTPQKDRPPRREGNALESRGQSY